MDKENKRSFQRSSVASTRSASKPIRTTASYMHAPKSKPEREDSRRVKKTKRNRRRKQDTGAQRKPFPWKKLLIGAIVLAAALVALLFILGSDPEVYHQMPKVTPPESVESMEGGV